MSKNNKVKGFGWTLGVLVGACLAGHAFAQAASPVHLTNAVYQEIDVKAKDGKVYGYPMWFYGFCNYLNLNHFKEAGLDPEKDTQTWEAFGEAAKRLTKKDGGKFTRQGFKFAMHAAQWTMIQFNPILVQSGGAWFDANGKCTVNNEAGVKAMTLANEQRGVLVGAFIVEDGDEILSITQGGQVVRSPINDDFRPTGRATMGVKFVTPKEGDAVAVKIFADAYGRDPEFYELVRTLEAYRKTIGEGTTLILSPHSDFFRLLHQLGERTRPGS